MKKKLDIRDVEYTVLSDAYDYMKNSIDERNNLKISSYEKTKEKLLAKLPENLKKDYENLCNNNIEIDLDKIIVNLESDKDYSGRDLSSHILNKLNNYDILTLGTDTSSSTKVYFNEKKNLQVKIEKAKYNVWSKRTWN